MINNQDNLSNDSSGQGTYADSSDRQRPLHQSSSAASEHERIQTDQPLQPIEQEQQQDPVIILPMLDHANKPFGVKLFGACFKFNSVRSKRTFHKSLVFCITFIAYTCFHMGRRPLSVVKNVLNRNCSEVPHHNQSLDLSAQFGINSQPYDDYYQVATDASPGAQSSPPAAPHPDNSCDWPPFDNDATANQLLALLDSSFLFSYAIFMFFSGFLAERCNLRYFLASGMVVSGVLLYAFGMAFYLDIHSMTYFVVVQILAGAVQTTGWPAVVACIGNWFETSSRGSIFGIWNANTNLGNILGATIAGYFVESFWGLSFIVPGFIMLVAGALVFLCMVPRPEDVGLSLPKGHHTDLKNDYLRQALDEGQGDIERGPTNRRKRAYDADSAVSGSNESNTPSSSEQSPLIMGSEEDLVVTSAHAASFWTCLKIPGVIEYSLCLGFAKLVSYTFLYWLPRYITQSTQNSSEASAYLSVPFDLGGILGAFVAGYWSDRYKKSAITCTVMLILAIPAMLIYEEFASISNIYNVCLQLMTGFLVNGPYSLITTAVSADLGSRVKDGKAMATVAAIIDGTGSIGAAVGPLFAGYVSDSGWKSVFLMLMASDLLASLCLARVTLKELGLR